MPEYLSSGVDGEKFDSCVRTVKGVDTSTAGFVGMAERGPSAGSPSLCTSFADFRRQFGGRLSERTLGPYRYLPGSVEQFFANGGTRCYVSRVVPGDAGPAEAEQGGLTLRAADEGAWGNRIQASFAADGRRTLQLIQREGELAYRARRVGGFGPGDLVALDSELNRIAWVSGNTVTFERAFQGDPVDAALPPRVCLHSVELNVRIRYEDTEERYEGVSLNPASDRYLAAMLSKSGLVTVERLEAPEDIALPLAALFGVSGDVVSLSFTGGSDGTPDAVNPGVFIGRKDGPGGCTGIQAFLENAEARIIAVPGVTMPEVAAALTAHCEHTRGRFAVLDMPPELEKTSQLLEYRSIIDSSYAAMYHPWINVYDSTAHRTDLLPPSGAVMGVYARTDMCRGVHKAPANETVACTGLSTDYNKGDQDVVYPDGVNLVRVLPGEGIRVWGARTASGGAVQDISVRRLFIFVVESVKRITEWVAFESNDAALWARVEIQIYVFLCGLFHNGMLAGASPEEAFFVSVGTSTMSRDDIQNGRLNCKIGIAPCRPAEFSVLYVTKLTAEAQN